MTRRLRSAAPIALTLSALAVTLLAVRLTRTPPKLHVAPPAPSSEPQEGPSVQWPENKALVYSLQHRAKQSLDLPGSAQLADGPSLRHEEVQVEIDADLVLQKCAGDSAVTWLAAKLQNVKTLRLVVGGQDKLAEPSAANGAYAATRAYLALSPVGQLHAVAFPRGTDGGYQRVMQHVLQQIAVVVSGESAWRTLEDSPFGLADTLYARKAATPGFASLVKQRVALQPSLPLSGAQAQPAVQIASKFDVMLADTGFVHDLAGSDSVTQTPLSGTTKEVGSAHTELHLRSELDASPLGMPPAEQLSLRPAGEPYVAPEERRAWLEQRAAGISFDQVYRAVSKVTVSAAFPGHQALLVQATAYLALHPDDCAKLAPLFIDPDAGSVRRGLVLDLLVSTDTPAAQAELRRLLQTPEALQDPSADMLLQRLSFVRHPDGDTAALLSQRFAEATGESRYASAYAMAAAVHHFNDGAKRAEARELNQQLLQAIDAAATDAERAQLVRSLSGARLAGNVPVLSRYAKSEDPSVRAATAFALRQTQTPESEKVVRKLMSDSSTLVKTEALRTMAQYDLDDDALHEMVGLAADRTIDPDLYGDVYSVLAKYQETKPELVRDAAQRMLAQRVEDRAVRVRLQFMANGM